MSPAPKYGTPAGDAALAIQRLARRTGGDVQELQTLYVLEALLARLAISDYRDDFVLKGGVLLAAFAVRRPTKDIDLQASGLANDADEVADRVRKVAALEFADVLRSVASFSDPVLTGTASGHWDAPSATWRDH